MIYAIFQYVAVAAIVGFSLWQVGKRWLPKTASSVAEPAKDGGCGSGACETCGACKTLSSLRMPTKP